MESFLFSPAWLAVNLILPVFSLIVAAAGRVLSALPGARALPRSALPALFIRLSSVSTPAAFSTAEIRIFATRGKSKNLISGALLW